MNRFLILTTSLVLVAALGCTHRPPASSWESSTAATEVVAEPPARVGPRTDAHHAELARLLGSGERCELAARELYDSDGADEGWRLLNACSRRGSLYQLRRVLSPPWTDEIRARPDGALLLGRVIAARGGDLEHDLPLLHRQRIPIFSLDDAIERPGSFDGRLVLVRARMRPDLSPHETATVLEETEVIAKVRPRKTLRQRQVRSVRYGRNGRRATTDWIEPYLVESEHVDVPTGNVVVAQLSVDDPFLSSSRTLLFLVRFQGARDFVQEGQEPDAAGVGEVVAWFDARTRFFE